MLSSTDKITYRSFTGRGSNAVYPVSHALLRPNWSFLGKLCAELLSLIVTSYSDGPSIALPVTQQFSKLESIN